MFRTTYCLMVLALICIVSTANAQVKKRQPQGAVSPRTMALYEPGEYKGLKYRLMKPIDWDAAKSYPLILSLHGGGGRGNDNVRNLRNWNEFLADEALRRKHPCFVLAPQSMGPWNDPAVSKKLVPELSDQEIASLSENWRSRLERHRELADLAPAGNLHLVLELIDQQLSKQFKIDTDRIYCLGHSMGGYGTFTTIYQHPDRFAAAIPTAGGFPPWRDVARIKDIPVWAFHGSADAVVPCEFTRSAFERMKEIGGNMKYTELRDVGHGVNAQAFKYEQDDPDKGYVTQYASERVDKTSNVWDWLFRQKLSQRK